MIVCENLVKIYKTKDLEVIALQGVDLTVNDGEMLAVVGNSGSGKSSLLNILGGLDRPSAGRVEVEEKNLLRLSEKELLDYRQITVGFVWQNVARNLVPYLSAQQNVEFPMMFAGGKRRSHRAKELLDLVGLSHRLRSRATELSGGEQQRVAIAIALANNPKLLLADEPTGNVDTQTAMRILDVFRHINRELGVTVVVVTHDRRVSHAVERTVAIRDGRISSEMIRSKQYRAELEALQANEGSAMVDPAGGALDAAAGGEEFAVVDKVGRLQLPEDVMEALGLARKRRVKVRLQDGRVVLEPPPEDGAEESAKPRRGADAKGTGNDAASDDGSAAASAAGDDIAAGDSGPGGDGRGERKEEDADGE